MWNGCGLHAYFVASIAVSSHCRSTMVAGRAADGRERSPQHKQRSVVSSQEQE